MTARERLEAVLQMLRRRLRRQTFLHGFAAVAVCVLLVTGVAALGLERVAFAPAWVIAGRVALGVLVALTVVLLVWRPLRRLRRNGGADVFEQRMPAQRGRIRTYLEGARAGAPASLLLDLLAEDAARVAERTPPATLVPAHRLGVPALLGVAAIGALCALLIAAPPPWRYASQHFLLGAQLPRSATPLRRLIAAPGDATVRRNSDLAITAATEGYQPEAAQVYVRFEGESDWERAPMRATSDPRAPFEFTLFAVRAPLSYYVEAQGLRTPEHRVQVVDLPRIERVRLTYAYPEWTGLQTRVDDDVRDIRAVAGTNVQVEVFADAPLEAAALIVNGAPRELTAAPNASVGAIEVAQPGSYRIGARVANEFVALSEDYVIEIAPDDRPTIEIRKPGRDWRASSIEEVPVQVAAEDDYRLRNVELRYSVNGGEWRTLPLDAGVKSSSSDSLLRLEELGAEHGAEARLAPGDLVSYYAVAMDRSHAVQTDLFMVQVQPFERRFRQSQAGGQAGGMGEEQDAISERQREILLATWNLQRNDERQARTRAQLRDQANMLAELQTKLAEQARTLAARTRARAAGEDERINTFIDSLERAANAMGPAAEKLAQFKLADAVPVEQQALQLLLRAEESFRDVQVAMQQDGAQGGGQQASRDFSEMFELEMDLEKNQYETESQASAHNQQAELAEALRKLKELAQRQEQLAAQAQRAALQPEEQRWRQEQLRREAEDLQRRLAAMNAQRQRAGAATARDDASSARDDSSESRQTSGAPSASAAARRDELERTLEDVDRAVERMQAANQQAERNPSEASAAARAAGEDLRRALRAMDRPSASKLDETLEQLAERATDLGEQQGRIESDLYRALSRSGAEQFGLRSGVDREAAHALVEAKQKLAADLTAIDRDLRTAVQEHRARAPHSTEQVSEAIRELESSEVMYRVNRSAAEIYYGRAREAALREGLIAEAIEQLEQNLREAALSAAREGERSTGPNASETLLAQAAELRRALQAGERSPEAHTAEIPALEAAAGWSSSAADSPRRASRELREDERSLARETAEITQRVRDAAFRVDRRELSAAEFDALRRRANELRRLAGDPLSERQAMLELVNQIELAALRAVSRTRETAARASPAAPDEPQYREAVAEYYRRLGGR